MGHRNGKTLTALLTRHRWLVALCAAYFFISLYLAYTLYYHFQVDTLDLAIFSQSLWTTVQGGWFFNVIDGMSHFGVHNSPILFFLLPACLIIPPCHLLLWITPLVIIVAAACFYALVYRKLEDKVSAVLAAAVFLLMPCIFVRNLCSFYENVLALPFVFLCLVFFEQGRFRNFMLVLFLALTAKEDVALTLALFGPYALLRRKSFGWIGVPLLLCVCWFVVSVWIVVPAFNVDGRYGGMGYFAHFGKTPLEMVHRIISEPGTFLNLMMQREKLGYFYYTFGQFLFFLPLVCLETLFLLPTLFFVLISESARFTIFISHNSLLLSAFLCACLVFSIRNLAGHIPRPRRSAFTRLVLLAALLGVLGTYPQWMNFQMFRPRVREEAIREALRRVPATASVKVPGRLTPYVYERWQLQTSEMEGLDADVIILDIGPSWDTLLFVWEMEQTIQDFKVLSRGTTHRCVFKKDGIFVFTKRDAELIT